MVVSPQNNKVVYWEAISNASSFVPGHTSSGVRGSIPALYSGEAVVEIINAEPAGFVLTTNHGRAAHLTVKDQIGRPAIGVQFLRKPVKNSGGSIFGTLRNALGFDTRKGVPIVRAGQSSKGQRDVVIASEDGQVEFWTAQLGFGNTLLHDVDVKPELLDAMSRNLPSDVKNHLRFQLLDVSLATTSCTSREIMRHGETLPRSAVLLVSLSQDDQKTYYLAEMMFAGEFANVEVLHKIQRHASPQHSIGEGRPHLRIPQPGKTAFVLFDTVVVIHSLVKIEESPTSQLMMEGNTLPEPFQDVVKFREDTIYRVLDSAMEDQTSRYDHAACVLVVQGFGIVRITTFELPEVAEEAEESRISAKSKIEQAVYFASLQQNPFDLTDTANQTFTSEEIEGAALEICREIMESSSRYLPKVSPSVDAQLSIRAKALDVLVIHVRKNYPLLSRSARWTLLMSSEQLAAAQAMWKLQEEAFKKKAQDRKRTLLQYGLSLLHEDRRTATNVDKGEKDPLRHWFFHDSSKIQDLIAWLVRAFGELENDGIDDPSIIAEYYCEASDLWSTIYKTAYRTREGNASMYGLEDEIFKQGVLTMGYKDVPQMWTSTKEMTDYADELMAKECCFLDTWWRPAETHETHDPTRSAVNLVAKHLPEQAEIYSRALTERFSRLVEQEHENNADHAVRYERDINTVKTQKLREVIKRVSKYDNKTAVIKIAEDLRDTALLVWLNESLVADLEEEQLAATAEPESISRRIRKVQAHVDSYFDTFGERWANSQFDSQISSGQLSRLLANSVDNNTKSQAVTSYLQRHPQYNKLTWINDIRSNADFGHASKILETLASESSSLFSQTTQLCFAKLSTLSLLEKPNSKVEEDIKSTIHQQEILLHVAGIQEVVQSHLKSYAEHAIDDDGALQMVQEAFAGKIVPKKRFPTLYRHLLQVLEKCLGGKILTAIEMVDLLTMMDAMEEKEVWGIVGREFHWALQVIDAIPMQGTYSDLSTAELIRLQEALVQRVWLRAMIRDNWYRLNDTADKSDHDVKYAQELSSLSKTIIQCTNEHFNEGQIMRVMCSPNDVLGQEVLPAALRSRLQEHEIDAVEQELEAQTDILRRYIEKARLQDHFSGLVKIAELLVREQADLQGEQIAAAVEGMEENSPTRDESRMPIEA